MPVAIESTMPVGWRSRIQGFFGPNDPRIPLYTQLRREWVRHGCTTPELERLEQEIKDVTLRLTSSTPEGEAWT
jgi:hypothetical protein